MSQQTPEPEYFDFDDESVKRLICPRCEAKPTNRCTTLSGKRAETHSARWQPLAEAYAAGEQSALAAQLAAARSGDAAIRA